MATGLGYQYTYYYYRVQNTQDPQGSLLESYYHYIKWLHTKSLSFTAADLLYQLKLVNAFFIMPNRSNEILLKENTLEEKTLNTLINTHLKNRTEYLTPRQNQAWRRSLFSIALAGTTFIGTILLLILNSSFLLNWASVAYAMPVGLGVGIGVVYDKPLFINPSRSSHPPRFNIYWAVLGILSSAAVLLAPALPITGSMLETPFLLTLVVPFALSVYVAFLATVSFISKPIKDVEEIQLQADPDTELKRQLTNFCQIEGPSVELQTAVEATSNCLLKAFNLNMDKPVMDLNVLEKELESKLSPN